MKSEMTRTHAKGICRSRIGQLLIATLIPMALGCAKKDAGFSMLADGQNFQQNQAKVNDKIDILWVVDDSGSMDEFQQNLVANFNSFMNNFQGKNFDFKMAVTTSGAFLHSASYRNNAALAQFRDGGSGWRVITPATPNLIQVFTQNAHVGIGGTGDERAFQSMIEALKHPLNAGFLRPGAFFGVVILSDEDDFSDYNRRENSWIYSGGIADHSYTNPGLIPVDTIVAGLDELTGSTATKRNYNVSAITILDEACKAQHIQKTSVAIIGQRYIELAQKTNGALGSICDSSFANSLNYIQQKIVESATEFILDREPNPSTIRVYVANQLIPESATNGWTYNASRLSISFHGYVPDAGADIRIEFDPARLR